MLSNRTLRESFPRQVDKKSRGPKDLWNNLHILPHHISLHLELRVQEVTACNVIFLKIKGDDFGK